MNDAIRVLHVFGSLNRGGAETMIMNIYRKINRSRIQFDFIVHTNEKGEYEKEIEELGGKIYRIPRYLGKNHINYIFAWNKFIKTHCEYKIIHGHVRSTASIYLNIAKKNGIITIAHSHNTSSGRGISAIVKNVMQYPIRYSADYFFACSKEAGVWLFGKKILKSENYFILKNAVDSEKFDFSNETRIEYRKKLSLLDNFVIGHVGRFHPQKNHEFLIEVFYEAYKLNPSTRLMLVGDGPLKEYIKDKADKLGVLDKILFIGSTPHVAELMQAMDAFVFPSLYEGLGIVIIEAQATGLMCIAADTIPSDTDISGKIRFLPLNNSSSHWAKQVIDSPTYKRENLRKEIIKSGYDIKQTSMWLQKFYLDKAGVH